MMKLHIKNMVSLRCIMFVERELKKIGINYMSVELGIIEIQDDIAENQLKVFNEALMKAELEVMADKKDILVEKIKHVIAEMVDNTDEFQEFNNADYISEELGYNYTYLSNIFSERVGQSIQRYILLYKLERVKEYLLYDELSLTEISHKLGFSNVAHISYQFKQITGLTPTYFKKLNDHRRRKKILA